MEQKDFMEMDIEEFDNLEEETKTQFTISDENLADWAVEKIKEEKTRFELFKSVANGKIERLKEQIKEEERKCATRNSYLLFKLNEYLDKAPSKKTKTSVSLTLPSGKIKRTLPKIDFTSLHGAKELKNDTELLSWCKDNMPEMVKVDESVTWGELKKCLEIKGEDILIKDTGEIIDCIGLIEKPMSVDVE